MAENEPADLDASTDALPCAQKMAFDTEQQAAAAGTAAEWQHGGSLRAYLCRYCQLWHLSSD